MGERLDNDIAQVTHDYQHWRQKENSDTNSEWCTKVNAREALYAKLAMECKDDEEGE